jgi:hypothetical protein
VSEIAHVASSSASGKARQCSTARITTVANEGLPIMGACTVVTRSLIRQSHLNGISVYTLALPDLYTSTSTRIPDVERQRVHMPAPRVSSDSQSTCRHRARRDRSHVMLGVSPASRPLAEQGGRSLWLADKCACSSSRRRHHPSLDALTYREGCDDEAGDRLHLSVSRGRPALHSMRAGCLPVSDQRVRSQGEQARPCE